MRSARWPIRDIAAALGRPHATVRRFVASNGWSRLPPMEPRPVVVRYERERPGEMLHLDTKKLGRIERTGTVSPAIGATTRGVPAGKSRTWP